jgi:peptidoglycan hydrolase CwlO-like protein
MMRKFGVVIAVLFMAAAFALRVNAEQTTNTAKPQGNGEAAQLHREIEALEQQAKPLRAQLQPIEAQVKPLRAQIQQLEAQAKPIREQLRPIQQKIKADREKLQGLRGERQEGSKEHRPEKKQSNQTQQ